MLWIRFFFTAQSSGSMFCLPQTCYVRPTRLGGFSLNMGRFFSLSHGSGLLLHSSTCACAHAEANPGLFFFLLKGALGVGRRSLKKV